MNERVRDPALDPKPSVARYAPHMRLFHWLRQWHRRIGLAAALFFLFLVLSGIALNHTDALRLDQRALRAPWLTAWYGLRAQTPQVGFNLGEQYLAWDTQQWTLGARVIARKQAGPLAALCAGQACYIATGEALFIYSPAGELIEKIGAEALPARPIERLARVGERIVLGAGGAAYASSDGIEWSAHTAPVTWSAPVALPAAERTQLSALYAPSIDAERVLLDLHSGRLFGRYGPLVVDIAAIALLLLALSGVWMYVRAMRMQKRRERT